jgi:dolichyl-phosphate-mannose-protein mannosyltransferase
MPRACHAGATYDDGVTSAPQAAGEPTGSGAQGLPRWHAVDDVASPARPRTPSPSGTDDTVRTTETVGTDDTVRARETVGTDDAVGHTGSAADRGPVPGRDTDLPPGDDRGTDQRPGGGGETIPDSGRTTGTNTTTDTDTDTDTSTTLTRLLGTAALRLGSTPRDRLLGWLGPLLVTALAAALRFANLGRPPTLVFDETHYVKHAWTLLKVGYEARWPDDPNPAFEAGQVDTFLPQADYAVHPQVGKWLIALGMEVAGPTPFGWRLAAAVAGTLSVLLVARIARRLFASTAMGTLAGGLLAVDGQAIVHSRSALLDGFLMLFVLAAFGALLVDRDQARRRLAAQVDLARERGHPLSGLGTGLGLGLRPWRLAAGVLLGGLAIGTKWSGLYFVAVFGVMTVAWDLSARRAAGLPHWAVGGLVRDGAAAFVSLVPVALATYLASWFSWFRTPAAYGRQWAATHPGEGVTWLPESLRSFWNYHQDMWGFHTTLTSEHTWAAHPLGWPVQWRPTAFYYKESVPAELMCGADRCWSAIIALGNPVLWWAACLALVAAVWWLVRHRDWRAGAVLSGVVAGWLPWLAYAHRTIFTFYSIAFAPWMVLAVVWALHRLLHTPGRRQLGITVTVALTLLVAVVGAFFYPLWTAQVTPYWFWRMHVWLPTWV